jgi:hypothetical protein
MKQAGGAGVEYYFGYSYVDSDLSCENYAIRQNMWTQSRYALEFFQKNSIPFWQMSNDANRINSLTDWLLSSSDGAVHVIYRRTTSTAGTGIKLDVGTYSVKWYNPRLGGSLLNGSITTIAGNGVASIPYGNPPGPNDGKDWAILIKKV